MRSQTPNYLNFQIILAYVKEVVSRRTVSGGGHEEGVTIPEIMDEFRFIFGKSEDESPIDINQITNALFYQSNGVPHFESRLDPLTKHVLWRLNSKFSSTMPQQKNPAPLRKSSISEKPKKANPIYALDYEMMLYDEDDLMREIKILEAKKSQLQKENDKLRLCHQMLSAPDRIELYNMETQSTFAFLADSFDSIYSLLDKTMLEVDTALL